MTERLYRIRIAAELSGVSEGLIRAWERRYGVLKPRRTPSGYRAYTGTDIEILKALKKLTREGVSIAEAARQLPAIRREVRLAARQPSQTGSPFPEQLARWSAQVMEAAARLDQHALEQVLGEAMRVLSPVSFFQDLLAPLLQEVGDRWHQGRLSVAQEHLISQAGRASLLALIEQAPRRARHHVLCACFPDEEHELALLGVALRFRHAGWRVTYLGARTPAEHVGRVARAIHPEVVALSAIASLGPQQFEDTLRTVLLMVPEGSTVVTGGAGALAHEGLATALGAKILREPADWDAMLEHQTG